MIPPRKKAAATDLLVGIFTVALSAFVMAVLYFARELLIPLALALLLAFLLSPVVSRIERWLGRGFAVFLTVATVCTLLGGLGWSLTRQSMDLAVKLPDYKANIITKLRAVRLPKDPGLERFSEMLSELETEIPSTLTPPPTPTPPPPFVDQTKGRPTGILGRTPPPPQAKPVISTVPADTPKVSSLERIQGVAQPLFSGLARAGLVIILVTFMLIQRKDLRARIIRLIGQGHISETTRAMDDAGSRVSRYLAMQLMINVSFGVAVGLGLYFIGVPNASLWGGFAAVLRFVPYFGVWIASAFPITLSLAVSPGWSMPLLTIALFMVLELLIPYFVEPLLYRASTGVSAIALIVAAVFWTWLWGPMGLLLSTPMTVCLVVMGRHVPRLAFFSVLLGDEEALTPAEECYHRLLAVDLTEAGEVVENYAKGNSLTAVYDDVLIPAVTAAEADFRRAALDDPQRSAVLQGVRDLIEELQSRPASPSKIIADQAVATLIGPQPLPAHCRVLCLPARGERDEIVCLMLSHLLRAQGFEAQAVPVNISPEALRDLMDATSFDAVCVSIIPPSTVIHARYLCSRLRAQHPRLKIIVGIWGATENLDEASEGLRDRGADEIVVSLAEAMIQLSKFATPIAAPMEFATIPEDEEKRLAALAGLDLLNAKIEPAFDRITRNLVRTFKTPIALVSLIDRERQFFKSQVGLPAALAASRETPRSMSICSHVIAHNELLVVEDLSRDPRFANNPLLRERGLRFYAGLPLRAPDGQPIGTICILDTKPRQFDEPARRLLQALGDEAAEEIGRRAPAATQELTATD